jgi:AAA+ ATPase superfamily predicted ATPase
MAVAYGITGGIPMYMSLIDDTLSIKDNIKTNFLMPNAYLFEEPGNLIKQECREPAQYNSIIAAVAGGASRMSEICTKTGLETSLCSSYLTKLMSIGIVKKELPFAETTSRKAIYSLEDTMFRFWYRFIPDNITAINRGLSENAYKKIEVQLPSFMSPVFEEICKQYLWELNIQGALDVAFTDLGRWWGNDPIQKREAEIDILAIDGEGSAIFGECKWTNENAAIDALDTLISRSKLFHYKKNLYYLFAKTGFAKGCIDRANEDNNIRLVSFDDINQIGSGG